MKSAFAKLMEKNPVESSHIAFRAGGNQVPILTRASGSATTGYQTMGNSKSFTTLGAVRMGDQDGNSPGSAIIPDDIFVTPGQPGKEYPERTFANVGNNVFQPDDNGNATLALLRRLGDQQFKAASKAPFEDYMAQQRLVKDLDEASRNASLSELGISRDIIRNLAAQRRQQNEDDYLRKMLDSGATPEAARKEIEDVRNANAIQEAKKVDDRQYQAKTLIQRMAMSRGVTPMVREPLNQSASIDNPQRSQAMSEAMGMPGEGFGTSPLDMNRQFMTPDFYRRLLRKSALSQESADEQGAFNSLLTRGQLGEMPSGAFSFATMKGQERQNQIELVAEGLESRLESLRARGRRIKKPLPAIVIAKDVLKSLYDSKIAKPGKEVLFSLETIQELGNLQLLIALNIASIASKNGYAELTTKLKEFQIPATGEISSAQSNALIANLKELVQFMNKNEPNIEIPFASASMRIPMRQIADILIELRVNTSIKSEMEAAHKQYMDWMAIWEELTQADRPVTLQRLADKINAPGYGKGGKKKISGAKVGLAPSKFFEGEEKGMDEASIPGAPGDNYDTLSNKELKAMLKERGLNQGGNSDALKARLRRGTN